MKHKRSGRLTAFRDCCKHLCKDWKRIYWSGERRTETRLIRNEIDKKEQTTTGNGIEFDNVFADLIELGSNNDYARKTYGLLSTLNIDTTDSQVDMLISELDQIMFASNINSVFYFYFPIVTHILYYKPKYDKELLDYLIEPNFVNETTTTKEMIPLIQGAMKYKLSENKYFLTKESQEWIMNELPKMEIQVEREIMKCMKELDE